MPEPQVKATVARTLEWWRKAGTDEKDEQLLELLVTCYRTKAAQDC